MWIRDDSIPYFHEWRYHQTGPKEVLEFEIVGPDEPETRSFRHRARVIRSAGLDSEGRRVACVGVPMI